MFFKKAPAKPAPEQRFDFALSSGFRGYKKFPLVVHGDKEAEKNNENFNDTDLRGKIISFVLSEHEFRKQSLSVFVDNVKIGAVYESYQISDIVNGRVVSVYAKVDEENVADSDGLHVRHRVHLFVKYSD